MISRSLFFSLLVVASMVFAAPAVGADEGDPVAEEGGEAYRKAFVEGRRLFEHGHWSAARERFQRAHALRPTPLLRFNIGSTYRREGKRRPAIAYYRRYLAEAPPDAELRALAAETIAELEAELGGSTPAPIAAAPAPAREGPVTMPEARDAGDRDAPPRPGRGYRIAGAGLALAGLTGLGWAGVEAWRADSAQAELDALPSGTPWTEDHQSTWDQGQQSRDRARLLAIAGGATLGAGAFVYWLGGRRAASAGTGSLAVAPAAGADFAGVWVLGDF